LGTLRFAQPAGLCVLVIAMESTEKLRPKNLSGAYNAPYGPGFNNYFFLLHVIPCVSVAIIDFELIWWEF
jgi:hypothetical protein